jgi:hypothetical protein
MTEPLISCPRCKAEIPLTESLAAPLIKATRQQYEQQLLQKDAEIARQELGIREREREVTEAKRTLDDQIASQVATQLNSERSRLIAEETRKAKLAAAAELDSRAREIAELHEAVTKSLRPLRKRRQS